MNTTLRKTCALLLKFALTGCFFLYGPVAGAEPDAIAEQIAKWQALAKADLDAIHKAIVVAHPGMLDEQNPGFPDLVEAGYQEALKLVPDVVDYTSAVSVATYYVASFKDGHLAYSYDVWQRHLTTTSGWVIDQVDGKYVVAGTMPDWPAPLPPKDAVWLGCDGRSADAIVKQDIARYWNRRGEDAVLRQIALFASQRYPGNEAFKKCRFQTASGETLEQDIVYRAVALETYMASVKAALSRSSHVSQHNSFTLKQGVLWINARNFNLQPDEAKQLAAMLDRLGKVKRERQIVFDVRGNGGGDSNVGTRIFDAATGGLRYDQTGLEQLPRVYAQWRVSDFLIDTIRQDLAQKSKLYGEADPQTRWAQGQLDGMVAAKVAGQTWFEQPGGWRITREEVAKRHGALARFHGKIAVITDGVCASACLDFVDQIRLVPGAIQVGATTSSDTNYLTVGLFSLPSGNRLGLPLKVWRNRPRGSGEPWVPDVKFDFDMTDDRRVRAATLAAMNAKG